ncbi:MAG: ketoacyl-ACP synthase III [Oscillospiraceae bacterium]|nr:ketoacyl-ACP synthase III [Oscillospiraceae bacterium]
MSLKITGAGKGIPAKRVFNDELAGFLDTDDAWISSRTGIKSRYLCVDETLTDLSAAAASQALQNAGLSPGDIDLILCSTVGGDYRTPSLACCVAERVGARCPCFDVNAACTGFVYALEIASLFLRGGRAGNILIIAAEMMSALTDWTDRNTCVLFGDGAAACVVTAGNALRYLHLSSDAGADAAVLNIPGGGGNSPFAAGKRDSAFLRMQGQEVFKFAVGIVETEMLRMLDALKLSPEQIDWLLLHQANKRIIDCAVAKLKQPKEKFPCNIDRYGNLSSVSIPLLLFEMLEDGRLKPGDTVFMSAFGAGLTAGSCLMVWE